MSASRTLLRKQTKQRVALADGRIVYADRETSRRRVRKGTVFGRHQLVGRVDGFDLMRHPTKAREIVRIKRPLPNL